MLPKTAGCYSKQRVSHVVKSHADAFIEKSAQFHTERTDREILGRPVARYSGVVVSHVVKSHADAFIEKSAQFHAERTDREVLARYSGLFLFRWKNVVESCTDAYLW